MFETLYDVAREYIQVVSRQEHVDVGFSSFAELFGLPANNGNSQSLGAFGLDPTSLDATGTDSNAMPHGRNLSQPMGSRENPQEVQSSWEIDAEGAKLGDWFQKNHDMMRMMEVNL